MPRIIVLDTLSPDGLKLLDEAKAKGIEYEVRTGLKGDALRGAGRIRRARSAAAA